MRCVAFVALSARPIGAQAGRNAAAPGLTDLLARAGDYVTRFETAFSNVVSEERYVQSVIPGGPTYVGGPRPQHREMVSDFLLVRLPGSTDWLPFRDVFEVDNQPVRDREDRLMKLFLHPDAASAERAGEITEQSARYNIGIIRTVNHPLMALQVLREAQQSRFRFANPKPDASVAPGVVAIEFTEHVRPSLIRGPGDRDMMMRGRLWIDAEHGTIVRSEILVDTPAVGASIVTRFEDDAVFGAAVPIEMREEYRQPNGTRMTGTAIYSRFRRFGVQTIDELRK